MEVYYKGERLLGGGGSGGGVTMDQVNEAIQAAIGAIQIPSDIPSGSIVIWSGSTTNVPSGWALCNGANGTPDLSGRFVLGYSSAHPVGEKKGSETVTLTTAQMPSHTHSIALRTLPIQNTGGYVDVRTSNMSWTESPLATDSAGGGQAHENMPPYYALAYIMKL